MPRDDVTIAQGTDTRPGFSTAVKAARGLVPFDELEDHNILHHILECLWIWIVHPVLEALDLARLVSALLYVMFLFWC